MNRLSHLAFLLMICFSLISASAGRCDDASIENESSNEFFEKEVRPILVARCFECHSGGERAPKGGLRLDSREFVLKGGDTGPAVSLDDPAKSLFLSAINYGDIYQMPPKSKLPASEIVVLSRWITSGLPWPKGSKSAATTVKPFDVASRAAEHWCWQPIKDAAPPTVSNGGWPHSAVDRFILAKLESKGIFPAESADKRALLRRVYFDLIGLPPSPEEVEEFNRDQDPRAFEKIVDRLLGSVHFGERWGRHWLDLTRYAETRGHEFEPIIPNAWQYRDYVIRALNADVRYDRFLTEHLAGDLVTPRWRDVTVTGQTSSSPINESLLGTGFWFLGEEVHSPVDIRKDETDRMDNRLDVMSKTFLGLTVACARCHDHKFDAISQKDYYALAGYAISSSYRQIRVDTIEQHQRIASQLDEFRSQARRETAAALLAAIQPVLNKLDLYWLVANRALDDGVLTADAATSKSSAAEKTIGELAASNSLERRQLALWCKELASARSDKQHPLHLLFNPPPKDPANRTTKNAGQNSNAPGNSPEDRAGLVVDFGDVQAAKPIQNGVSFGLKPIVPGCLTIAGTEEAPQVHVATVGAWERDLFWKNITLSPGTDTDYGTIGGWQTYGRMVRSPEFTLTSKNAWYLVRGSIRAYASVNSHLVIGGPLHGSLTREFKHDDDKWHWVQHGLDNYRGHRLHVEFSPADDAPCAVAMVWQGDDRPKLPEPTWNWIEPAISAGPTLADRAAAGRTLFLDAAKLIGQSNLTAANQVSNTKDPTTAGNEIASNVASTSYANRVELARLAHWIVSHRDLFSAIDLKIPVAQLHAVETELAKRVRWDSSLAPAMLDGNDVDEFLLVRGNSNTPKEPVARRFLQAFHHPESAASDPVHSAVSTAVEPPGDGSSCRSGSRLELANEMIRSPLVPRVAVNRIWHHLFGRGIVPSVDNMGVLGLPPSHPELLDHLATQFVRDGWSVKSMIRSLVLSRTYQMSSHPTDADSIDPDNELWHRMPIRRLEGEAIRDSLLAVSGRLDRTTFGPSVPIHLTAFMQGRGRPGASGPLDGNGRRSIYISVRRNFLSPMMLAFDTPAPFSTVGRRTVSNVPAQALILMNDPFVIEQANRWAERILADSAQWLDQRVDRMYLTAFARPATASEKSEAISFLDAQGVNQPDNQREAWKNLCHVLFNVKEFVFIE